MGVSFVCLLLCVFLGWLFVKSFISMGFCGIRFRAEFVVSFLSVPPICLSLSLLISYIPILRRFCYDVSTSPSSYPPHTVGLMSMRPRYIITHNLINRFRYHHQVYTINHFQEDIKKKVQKRHQQETNVRPYRTKPG